MTGRKVIMTSIEIVLVVGVFLYVLSEIYHFEFSLTRVREYRVDDKYTVITLRNKLQYIGYDKTWNLVSNGNEPNWVMRYKLCKIWHIGKYWNKQ